MKKLLVIEDNQEVRENLEEILSLSNYDVVTAEDGLVGVEKALKEKPNLIICDVMMPKLDGFGVLRILSQKAQTSHIPFIFLTAKTEVQDMRKGMGLGADDYITKPFQSTELLDAVEIRLQKSERLEQLFQQDIMSNKTLIDESKGLEDLNSLYQNKESKSYNKKDILFREGDLPKRIYYIVKGKVKTYRSNEYGKELVMDIYIKNDFLDLQSAVLQEVYEATAMVIEEAEIISIPIVEFQQLLNSSRDFSTRFIKMLAGNIQTKEEQLLKLAYNSTRKRVADALILLDQQCENNGERNINILREDLAGIVGTAKESISRMLTDFKSEKLIEIDSTGIIKVIDKGKLADLPN